MLGLELVRIKGSGFVRVFGLLGCRVRFVRVQGSRFQVAGFEVEGSGLIKVQDLQRFRA